MRVIQKTLTEEQIDFTIDLIFIHLERYFTEEDFPLSSLSKETKIGEILDEVLDPNGLTIRELISDVAAGNSVSLSLSKMPEPHEIVGLLSQIKKIKAMTKVDISSIVDFFTPLSIQDVLAFQVPTVDLNAILNNKRSF